MVNREIEVELAGGLEARAIAMMVQIACQYDSQIYMQYRDKRVNAKSIMGMLSLGVALSDTVNLSAEGADEEEAMQALENYLKGE